MASTFEGQVEIFSSTGKFVKLFNVQGMWALIMYYHLRVWMLIEIIFVILECGVLSTQFVVIHSFFR